MAQGASDVGGAGEGDFIDIRVGHDHRPGFAAAGDHVDHPWRQTGFGDDLGEEQGAQAGVGSWFEHHRVSHRNGGGDLPGQHQQAGNSRG